MLMMMPRSKRREGAARAGGVGREGATAGGDCGGDDAEKEEEQEEQEDERKKEKEAEEGDENFGGMRGMSGGGLSEVGEEGMEAEDCPRGHASSRAPRWARTGGATRATCLPSLRQKRLKSPVEGPGSNSSQPPKFTPRQGSCTRPQEEPGIRRVGACWERGTMATQRGLRRLRGKQMRSGAHFALRREATCVQAQVAWEKLLRGPRAEIWPEFGLGPTFGRC